MLARRIDRRALLAGGAGLTAALVARAAGADSLQVAAPGPRRDPPRLPGAPASELGQRSPFERPRRGLFGSNVSVTPLQDLHGVLTPSDLHYEVHRAGVPRIDPADWRLLVHGMVERPRTFTLADLERFPAVSRIAFLECSGNIDFTAPAETTPQNLCGLTSQSEWTGVALATLFREVGVREKATWFLAEGSDAVLMARSIPVSKGWDDAMIAYAQNGEAIRPEQGYPARLLTPGWEGNTNVKWIRRIELADRPFMTREETARYTEPLKNGTARQFSFVMDARSVITFPAYPIVVEKGWIEIRGIAWTGRGRIARVEVSTDGGRRWAPATLQEPVLPKAWTRFRHLWEWDGQPTEIASRAIDETGYVQPTRRQLVEARGRGSMTSSHINPITAWRVRPDGQVVYREEE